MSRSPLTEAHVASIRCGVTAAALRMFLEADPAAQLAYLKRCGLTAANAECVARILPGLRLTKCDLTDFPLVIDTSACFIDHDLLANPPKP